jgi:hypothetical protein
MRLSEAALLGRTITNIQACNIDRCFLGAALNAMGLPDSRSLGRCHLRYLAAETLWPWITCVGEGGYLYENNIIDKFDESVSRNEMTYEQLVDWVRSVEPNCDCGEFNCSCAAEPVTETKEVHATCSVV